MEVVLFCIVPNMSAIFCFIVAAFVRIFEVFYLQPKVRNKNVVSVGAATAHVFLCDKHLGTDIVLGFVQLKMPGGVLLIKPYGTTSFWDVFLRACTRTRTRGEGQTDQPRLLEPMFQQLWVQLV